MLIGVDFDNTLAGYDHLFAAIAREDGVLAAPQGGKRGVRDAVRLLPDGDAIWTAMQAKAYGARMAEARLIEGAGRFLAACRDHSVPVVIVSHKTRHAAADPGGVDLHGAALDWMEAQGFFRAFGLSRAHIYFEPTRREKCLRIAALGCSHFIDDLEEVFNEPDFPGDTDKLLLHLENGPAPRGRFRVFPHWSAIHDALLPAH